MDQANKQSGASPAGESSDSISPEASRGVLADAKSWISHSWVWQRSQSATVSTSQWLKQSWGAFTSPIFLGLAPFFAKMAYNDGAATYTVVAMRMILAAGFLWIVYSLFARKYIKSWWLGIASSALAGIINGLGSICYYQGLARIDASLASILNISYLVFVTLLLRIMGQAISRLTLFRLVLAFTAVYLLATTTNTQVDSIGVALLLIGSLAYATQLVLGQRVLYDIPSPTMTLYSMTAMAGVVTVAWFFSDGPELTSLTPLGLYALLAFAGVTALSRLTLFQGVQKMGSVQTATLGVSEVLITVLFAMLFLGETLATQQWFGAALMSLSVFLLLAEKDVPRLVPIPLLQWAIKVTVFWETRKSKIRR